MTPRVAQVHVPIPVGVFIDVYDGVRMRRFNLVAIGNDLGRRRRGPGRRGPDSLAVVDGIVHFLRESVLLLRSLEDTVWSERCADAGKYSEEPLVVVGHIYRVVSDTCWVKVNDVIRVVVLGKCFLHDTR